MSRDDPTPADLWKRSWEQSFCFKPLTGAQRLHERDRAGAWGAPTLAAPAPRPYNGPERAWPSPVAVIGDLGAPPAIPLEAEGAIPDGSLDVLSPLPTGPYHPEGAQETPPPLPAPPPAADPPASTTPREEPAERKRVPKPPANLLDYPAAAEYLSMPRGTLYNLVWAKRIPHIRISRRTVRFDPAVLARWLDQRRVE